MRPPPGYVCTVIPRFTIHSVSKWAGDGFHPPSHVSNSRNIGTGRPLGKKTLTQLSFRDSMLCYGPSLSTTRVLDCRVGDRASFSSLPESKSSEGGARMASVDVPLMDVV